MPSAVAAMATTGSLLGTCVPPRRGAPPTAKTAPFADDCWTLADRLVTCPVWVPPAAAGPAPRSTTAPTIGAASRTPAKREVRPVTGPVTSRMRLPMALGRSADTRRSLRRKLVIAAPLVTARRRTRSDDRTSADYGGGSERGCVAVTGGSHARVTRPFHGRFLRGPSDQGGAVGWRPRGLMTLRSRAPPGWRVLVEAPLDAVGAPVPEGHEPLALSAL